MCIGYNKVPKCKCNQILLKVNFKYSSNFIMRSLFLSKYYETQPNLSEYNKIKNVINGFVRSINSSNKIQYSLDILSIISSMGTMS